MSVKKSTLKKLWAASGNQCAFPGCDEKVVDLGKNIVIGEVCHIRAESPGGPRYDPDLDEDEKDEYHNLILLCPTHHTVIDKASDKYSAQNLEQWKKKHEEQSHDVPEISDELLQMLGIEFGPSSLLVHLKKDNIDFLAEAVNWKPSNEFPRKAEKGQYPILVTFRGLRDLHSRLAAPYMTRFNGEPSYKYTEDLDEEHLIRALSIASKMTQLAIQYHRVEGNRRKFELLDKFDNSSSH